MRKIHFETGFLQLKWHRVVFLMVVLVFAASMALFLGPLSNSGTLAVLFTASLLGIALFVILHFIRPRNIVYDDKEYFHIRINSFFGQTIRKRYINEVERNENGLQLIARSGKTYTVNIKGIREEDIGRLENYILERIPKK